MTFETKFRNFVGRIRTLTLPEIEFISKQLLEELNTEQKVSIDSWKGKSSFKLEEVGDLIIVTKYQRPDKDSEAKPIKYEIEVSELRELKKAIIRLKEITPIIKSRQLGEYFYQTDWDTIFSNRKRHNHFNIMLNVLDKKGFIKYQVGKIE